MMNTEEIRKQTTILDDLRKKREEFVQSRNKVLAVKCGQETCAMVIASVRFDITSTNQYYMPEVVKGMEVIQKECSALLQAQIDTLSSKILGAENKLKRLTSNNT